MGIFGKLFGRSQSVPVLAAVTANSADIPENERYWRKVGESGRNLPGLDQRRMIDDAVRAFQRDGIASRAVRIKTGFVVGALETLPQVECADEDLRDDIERHVRRWWFDWKNDMPQRVRSYCDALAVTGELPVALFSTEGTALVRNGYIDPASIRCVLTHPENAQERIAVVRENGAGRPPTLYPVVGPEGLRYGPWQKVMMGTTVEVPGLGIGGASAPAVMGTDCMYLAVNDIPGMSRGISDLYPVLDLLALHDRIQFAAADRAENLAAFVWAAEFDGQVQPSEAQTILKDIRRAVESGSGNLIGQLGFKLSSVAPQLQSADWSEIERMTRLGVLIGLGLPSTWMGEGEGNFGAAGEMQSPAMTMLQERQSLYRAFLERMLLYVALRLPAAARAYREDPECFRVCLPLPVIVGKDTMREATVLTSELNALATAEADGAITKEAYQRFAGEALTTYGFTVRSEDVPDPDDVAAPRFQGIALPDPSSQVMPNPPGQEGGRGEDEAHTDGMESEAA